MRIAIDAMGGDNAPRIVIDGAVDAARDNSFEIVLVGDKDAIEKELARHRPYPANIKVHHARETIEMHEPPAISIRKKKDSSINVMVNLAKENQVDAIVSAGNTGAVVCAATLGMRTIEGVERPGIAVVIPTLKGATLLIDVGANIDAKPKHLLQYGIMGHVYSKYILGKKNPRIGLLNIGEEESKGTEFLKEAYKLLEQSNLNFIGNSEGRDIFTGKCDVTVCDGFIGNVVLKVSESLTETIGELLRRELNKGFLTRVGALLSKPAFRSLKKEIDYSEYGGAPLLGIDGICIIAHGGSTPKAIKNAIRVAGQYVVHHVNKHIMDAINEGKV